MPKGSKFNVIQRKEKDLYRSQPGILFTKEALQCRINQRKWLPKLIDLKKKEIEELKQLIIVDENRLKKKRLKKKRQLKRKKERKDN
jgi:hypothetical protein